MEWAVYENRLFLYRKEINMDYELILFDRLNIIKDTINKYGEDKFYIAFSGGKDSTVLHHLIDMALPNNQLSIMKQYFPIERQQCEIIWKPVYEEYRRIKYRLKGE